MASIHMLKKLNEEKSARDIEKIIMPIEDVKENWLCKMLNSIPRIHQK